MQVIWHKLLAFFPYKNAHFVFHYILSDFVKIVIALWNKDNIEKKEDRNSKTSVKTGFQTTCRVTI